MRWKGDEIEGGEGQIAEHVELPRGPFLGLQDDSGKGVLSAAVPRPRKDLFSRQRRCNWSCPTRGNREL